jgi:amino acid transporter
MPRPERGELPSSPPSGPAPAGGAPHADERLNRAIGPWSLGANAVNLSVGAGIFALPAVVAVILGPAAILAYLVCGLAIALVLTCFAEIGSQVTRSGGAVAYIEDAFGPMAGFVAWVVFSLGFCVASNAAVATVLLDTVSSGVPAMDHGAWRAAAFIVLYAVLAAVNILGVRLGARLAVITTAGKLLPLLLIIGAGAMAVRWQELRWTAWPSIEKVGEASLVLFFAFSGAESAVTPSGEIRDPSRTIPRGLLGGTAFLILLYISVQLVSQGVLGPGVAQHGQAPLADVAGRLFGAGGRGLVIACTALATLGLLGGDLLATPRSFLPMAEDRMLPAAIGAVHPTYRTPHVAIATYAAASCLLAISGAFKPLAVIASVSLLLVYLAVCLAALKLRVTRELPPGAFRAPGGPIVPVLGALTVLGLLAQTTRAEMIGIAIALAVAAMYYVVRRRVSPSAGGPDYRAAGESDLACPP